MQVQDTRIETASVTCAAEPDIVIDAPSFQRNGIDIYVCPSCGTYVSDCGYSSDQYDDSYYTIASTDTAEIEGRWGFRWRYVLDQLLELSPGTRTVLDVGAGNGLFTKIAGEEYGLDATGIEISAASVDFARDVLGVELLVEDLADHDGTYDCVTAFSVIEHVSDPLGMLEQLAERVTPGGVLILATPNPKCIQRRIKGEKKWGMICPPHHLNIFSRRGLEDMVGTIGLHAESWETISTSVKLVRRFDTPKHHLRRAIFHAFRAGHLGADQLLIARKPI